jgi:hypothetical protein
MPNLPTPDQTNIAVQNNVTGQVDYLQFTGTTLTSSRAFDYGITGWNVVAHGNFNIGGGANMDLVIQNAAGAVDFLGLDANGNLVSSAMSSSVLPPIVGGGFFNTAVPGEFGPTLVSQLANGQLDMLAFDNNGKLLRSDLIPNSVGLPHAVGVGFGTSGTDPLVFSGVGVGTSSNVMTQLADGSIDALGFSGDFAAGTLSFTSSLLLPGSAGSPALQAINQNDLTQYNESLPEIGNNLQGAQMITQLADGSFDALYADSGYGGSTHRGNIYASELLNLSMPGWHAVDAGAVAAELFPFT